MNPEIKQNFEERLRLVVAYIIEKIDQDIKLMLAEHSRDGLLRSGATIKKTMRFISDGNNQLYQEVFNHLSILKLSYYPQLETEIQELAGSAQNILKIESLKRLQKSTEIANNPRLCERMLPEVEKSMANDLANFQNRLNVVVLELKFKTNLSKTEKILWVLEGLLLLVTMFVAGMWFNDPNGNYEPALVGLGLVMPLIYFVIKISGKKT